VATTVVSVRGLKELRRDLRAVEDVDGAKQVRRALLTAAEIVAAEARSRVPARTGRARGSIKAGASGNRAYVAGGKRSVDYYGWLDFGGRTPRQGQQRRVGPWARSGRGPEQGRFIYPALEASRADVIDAVSAGLDQHLAARNL
jgi:HK97 gp10 family phage protein